MFCHDFGAQTKIPPKQARFLTFCPHAKAWAIDNQSNKTAE